GGRRGHYVVHAGLAEVPPLLATVTTDLGLARLDDFRVARPTLEDVYLSLAAMPKDDDAALAPQPASRPEARPVAPSGQPRRRPARRFGVAFTYLWLEQMLGVRTTWSWTVLFGLLMPLAMVFGATRIGTGLTDRTSLLYIISGAAVFAVSTEGIAVLAQQVGQIRNDGMMLY